MSTPREINTIGLEVYDEIEPELYDEIETEYKNQRKKENINSLTDFAAQSHGQTRKKKFLIGIVVTIIVLTVTGLCGIALTRINTMKSLGNRSPYTDNDLFLTPAKNNVVILDGNTFDDYRFIKQEKYNLNKSISLQSGRLMLLDAEDHFVVITSKDLKTYNFEGTEIHTVPFPYVIKNAVGVLKTSNGCFMVCDINTGLHIIDYSGNLIITIDNSSFADLASYKGSAYALDYSNKTVRTYTYTENQWQNKKDINVDVIERLQKRDGLTINNDNIYISSAKYGELFIFSLEGRFLSKYINFLVFPGGGSTRLSYGNRVCSVDSKGTVFLVDTNDSKNQLVFCSVTGDWWKLLLTQDKGGYIQDAILNVKDNSIWLTKQDILSKQDILLKYEQDRY